MESIFHTQPPSPTAELTVLAMKGTEAIERAQILATQKRVSFSAHAHGRMKQRKAQAADVLEALLTAKNAKHDPPPNEKWKIQGGPDLDGDALDVVIERRGDGTGHVVTVF